MSDTLQETHPVWLRVLWGIGSAFARRTLTARAGDRESRTRRMRFGLISFLIFAASVSPAFGQDTSIGTTTTLSSSANPSIAGQPVLLTATINGGLFSSRMQGTVTFKDGSTTLATQPVTAAVATYSATLSTGVHSLTAYFGGYSNWLPSTSLPVSQKVKAASTVTLFSSWNPSVAGGTVVLTANVAGSSPTGNVTFKDGTTTLATVSLSSGVATYSIAFSAGTHSVVAVYAGDANNSSSTSSTLSQQVKSTTTTTLSSSANPSVAGQSVVLTARVTGSSPTGAVTFKDGGTTLATLSLSSGVASYSASLAVGAHNLVAVYAGDANNNGSTSSTLAQQVKATSSTALSSSINPSVAGQSVVLTARVTGSSPTGNVTFKDGGTTLSVQPVVSGVASYSAAFAAGTHSLAAVYAGDAYNVSSTSSTLNQQVKATSAVTLSSSANPSLAGQSVVLTATVTGNGPTGYVTFKEGGVSGATLSTQPLVSGSASYTGSFTAGTHNVLAVYEGDANNASSTSALLPQVAKVATVTTLSSGTNPAIAGQAVTLTATVAGSGPTGSVTFMDGGVTLATQPLALGAASYSTSFTAGTHNLTAVYAGDAANASSTSAAISQEVQPPTVTVLSSSKNPSQDGDVVLLTATVTGSSPTGTVTFKDGGATLSTQPLVSGAASFSTSFAAGTHNLVAEYAGDANNVPSASTILTQRVQGASVTVLSSSTNPAVTGESVVLTATVTGSSPTGTVTFMDGGTTLAAQALVSGSASYSGSFTAGAHSLTAVYSGDSINGASSSAAIAQQVKAASATSLASSANPSPAGQTVTLTATVAGSSPTGTVTFKDGGTTLSAQALVSGSTSISVPFTAGTHSLVAVYGGDANNGGSSATLTQQAHATSITTLSSSANPSLAGQPIVLTATVTGSSPTGTVTFKDGSTVLAANAVTSGVATYSGSFTAGAHNLVAVYSGDAGNTGSTSSVLNQVAQTASTTSLSSSANPPLIGQLVVLTATVSGNSPTGSVAFKDGAATLATQTLTAGSATYSGSFTAGTHSLVAVYGGDANNASSSSSALTQTVASAQTTTTLSISPNTASLGQNVTLIARVSGYIPSGTVTFAEGATTIGTAPVVAGSATLGVSGLALGNHVLSASYAGDTNNNASNSSSSTLTVLPRAAMAWQYGYDPMGRVNTVVDPNGLTTYFYYDSLGRRIQTQQPPNTGSSSPTVTQFGYDGMDSLTNVTDPRNLSTTYTRDGLGNAHAQSSPDSGNSGYTYDAKGNVLTSTDARGKTSTFSYDALDRLKSIGYPTGTPTTFEYDGGASPTPEAAGELTKMTDESGQTIYTYDSLGRLTAKTLAVGAKTYTVGYAWGDSGSALDKLVTITYPSGSQLTYSYDQYGSVSGITVNPVNANGQGVAGTSVTLLGGITYNAEGNVTGWVWSDGKPRTIGYDSNGLISSYSLGDPLGTGASAGLLRTLTRDAAGRIKGYTHTSGGSAAPAFDQTFDYDDLNRLKSDTQGASTTLYSYDATGSRTSKTIGGTTYTNTIDSASNRLAQVQDVTGTATINHDAAGNVVGDGSFTYTYSDRGRLAAATTAAGTVSYLYNGLGQRVRKSGPTSLVPGGASYYVYDESGQLLGEYDASGTPVYETVYLGSIPVGVLKESGSAATNDLAVAVYNVHADQISTPRMITRQDETIVWRWDTAEAFGATAPDQNPNGLGAFVFNQRFPGQVFDAETGLFQNWNRDYDAKTGRYRQVDPIGLAGGINPFAYVGGNPLSYIDPLGLRTGVTIWQPVGWGESSFGHVSVDINGTTFSFGPGGMATMPTSDYTSRNDFRSGTEIELPLTPQQEAALQQCLSKPQGDYNAATNNCGSPVQSCLKALGMNTGNQTLPASLGNKLIDMGLVKGVKEYPQSRPSTGRSAPWAR